MTETPAFAKAMGATSIDHDLLELVLSAPGLSGYESPVQRALLEWLGDRFECGVDRLGSLWATSDSRRKPCVGVAAHCDQVGFVVTCVDDDGFLVLADGASIGKSAAQGSAVTVHAKNGPIQGVIGVRPPHKRVASANEVAVSDGLLLADIGAASRDRADELVRIGDPVTFSAALSCLDGQVITSPALDDRVGVYVALRALELVQRQTNASGAALTAISTVREETGFVGARGVANYVTPDVMVVVDVIHSGDDPTLRDSKAPTGLKLGAGPAIARGLGTSGPLLEEMFAVGERNEIDLQLVAIPGESGTDFDHLVGSGSAMINVNVPLRYMHSAVEVVDLRDVEAAAQLIAAFATGLDAARWDEVDHIYGLRPASLARG